MIRAEVLRQVGGYPSDAGSDTVEDYALWLSVVRRCKIVALPEKVLCLRKHGENVTRRRLEEHKRNVLGVLRVALEQRLGEPLSLPALSLLRGEGPSDTYSLADYEEASAILVRCWQELV
jgi:hypothetical protein